MASVIEFDTDSLDVFFNKTLTYTTSSLTRILVDNGANAAQAVVSLPSLINILQERDFMVEGYVRRQPSDAPSQPKGRNAFLSSHTTLRSRERAEPSLHLGGTVVLPSFASGIGVPLAATQLQTQDRLLPVEVVPMWARDLHASASQHVRTLRADDEATYDLADESLIAQAANRDDYEENVESEQLREHIRIQYNKKVLRPQTRHEPYRPSDTNLHGRIQAYQPADDNNVPSRCPSTCANQSAPGSRHCVFHIQRAIGLLHYPATARWQEELTWLSGLAREPRLLWIIDTEFAIFTYACPVAFEVCIRRFDGEVVLRCPVDYNGATVDQLISVYHALCPPGHRLAKATLSRIRACFARVYPNGEAWGTTFSQMRDVTIKAGFDPATHAVVSYATTIDMQVFWKLLAGLNEPFVAPSVKEDFRLGKEKRTCLQPVNVFFLARAMMTCKEYSLQNVYRHLYGLEEVKLHRAGSDTMIMLDVMRALLSL